MNMHLFDRTYILCELNCIFLQLKARCFHVIACVKGNWNAHILFWINTITIVANFSIKSSFTFYSVYFKRRFATILVISYIISNKLPDDQNVPRSLCFGFLNSIIKINKILYVSMEKRAFAKDYNYMYWNSWNKFLYQRISWNLLTLLLSIHLISFAYSQFDLIFRLLYQINSVGPKRLRTQWISDQIRQSSACINI